MRKALCLTLALAMALGGANAPARGAAASVDAMVLDGNYTEALAAAEKIVQADPDNLEAYLLKARIRIMALSEANRLLNEMVAEDVDQAPNRAEYMSALKALYAQAGLTLTIPFSPDYAAAEEINAEGGYPLNLSTALWLGNPGDAGTMLNGVFAAQGGWIYYVDPQNGYSLWKMPVGGGARQQVLNEMTASLNVAGDWIYYRAVNENSAIYKIRTDGSGKTLVTADSCVTLCVKDDWIYYDNAAEKNALYTVNIDGTQRRSLGRQGVLHFLSDVYLYYSSEDEKTLYRMHIWDFSETVLLKKQWHITPVLLDGRIYYTSDNKGMIIRSMLPDGKGSEDFLRYDGKIYRYAFLNHWFFLSTRASDGNEVILRYDAEGRKDPVQIGDTSTEAFCTDALGNLYFLNNNGLYLIHSEDGTAEKIG